MQDPFGTGTLWLKVASDGLIAAAYYAIRFALYYLARERRTEIPYPWDSVDVRESRVVESN
jgi:hypothetical protein